MRADATDGSNEFGKTFGREILTMQWYQHRVGGDSAFSVNGQRRDGR